MDGINVGLSALAVGVLIAASCFAEPPSAGGSAKEPSVQKKVAFHVIGLMKTKSGAT